MKVELSALSPTPQVYLARLAYLLLVLFENMGRAVTTAPTTAAKSTLSGAASELLDAHHAVVAELVALGADPTDAMEPYHRELDDFQRRTQGADWYEILVTCYLTAGFLSDFYAGLAGGLPKALGARMTDKLQLAVGEHVLVELLRAGIDQNSRLASRLALWGRRLVGDTMLVAQDAIRVDGQLPTEERIEPVFTELVSEHTRRMDALGLTA